MGLGELDRLLTCWENLGERERGVVLTFMNRLWAGQKQYGKLTLGKKEWGYEAYEETLDACVYLTAKLNDFCDLQRKTIEERSTKSAVEQNNQRTWIENYYTKLGPEAVEVNKLDPNQEWYWVDAGEEVFDYFGGEKFNPRLKDIPLTREKAAEYVEERFGVKEP